MLNMLKNFISHNRDLVKKLELTSHHTEENISPYHLEGSVWTHTLMVLREVVKAPTVDMQDLVITALLHDIGKIYTREITATGKARFIGHESISMLMAVEILTEQFRNIDIKKILYLINYHDLYAYKKSRLKHMFQYDISLYNRLRVFRMRDVMGSIRSIDIEETYPEIERKERKEIPDSAPMVRMLVGLPGSGKSTFAAREDLPIVSRDAILLEYATKKYDITDYNEAWKKLTPAEQKEINQLTNEKIKQFTDDNIDFIIDMTNVSLKSRARKLSHIPNHYKKVAEVFLVPFSKIFQINIDRNDKTLQKETIFDMAKRFKLPLYSEFDEINFHLYR